MKDSRAYTGVFLDAVGEPKRILDKFVIFHSQIKKIANKFKLHMTKKHLYISKFVTMFNSARYYTV